MFCPLCGTQHPDDTNFCMHCGMAIGAAPPDGPRALRWEYRSLTVLLGLDLDACGGLDDAVRRAEEILVKHLQLEGKEGWQADGGTDIWSLWSDGRIKEAVRYDLLANEHRWESVTVRLKRPVVG